MNDDKEPPFLDLEPDQWESSRSWWGAIKWKLSWFFEVTLPTIIVGIVVADITYSLVSGERMWLLRLLLE